MEREKVLSMAWLYKFSRRTKRCALDDSGPLLRTDFQSSNRAGTSRKVPEKRSG